MSGPSYTQQQVRRAFKNSCRCFNNQPMNGGAEPSGTGPYSRTWWYSQAAGSGLWYYDYFMSQSISPFLNHDIPKWCISGGSGHVVQWGWRRGESSGDGDIDKLRTLAYNACLGMSILQDYYFLGPGLFAYATNKGPGYEFSCTDLRALIKLPSYDVKGSSCILSITLGPAAPNRKDGEITLKLERVPLFSTNPSFLFTQTGPAVSMANTGAAYNKDGHLWLDFYIDKNFIPTSGDCVLLMYASLLEQANIIPQPPKNAGTTDYYRYIGDAVTSQLTVTYFF